MGEKRAASLLGAGIGGALAILGVFLFIAGLVDVPALVSRMGGKLGENGYRVARDSGTLAYWLGLAAVFVGVVLFVASVASRRRSTEA